MAVKESFELFILAQKSRKNFFRAQSRRQRQITAGDALRQAEKIRRYVRVLAGKHLAGPAETRGDFIKNEKNAVAPADVMQCLNITDRLRPHARRALHERLHDQRSQSIFVCGELLFCFFDGGIESASRRSCAGNNETHAAA